MKKIIKYFLFALTLCVLSGLIFLWNTNNYSEREVELHHDKMDENRLFDLNFAYILNSPPCNNDTFALYIVTSYFGNVETRSAMRRAFSKGELDDLKVRRIFLLGIAPNDRYTNQRSIDNENKRFGDIIQGNFREAYRNLTYKHLMGLKWAATNCKSAQFVVKMDDDIVVDFMKIYRILKSGEIPKNTPTGYIMNDMEPVRNKANKWFVTKEEYGGVKYPQFLSGWFYIVTPQIALKLLKESYTTKYFWIDDLYVTGILVKKLNLTFHSINEHFTTYPEYLQCCIRDINLYRIECDIIIGPNGGDNNLFHTFNNAIKICRTETCSKRTKSTNDTCVGERKLNLYKGNALVNNYKLF